MPCTLRSDDGLVVPMPTEPFSSTVKSVVEAEFAKLTSWLVPVPLPHTESFAYGVVVPIATLPWKNALMGLV